MKATKVLIFVEGPSDEAAMRELLAPLLEAKRKMGIKIEFFEAPEGDKKDSVLRKVPIKAVNIILHDPDSLVVALPDLYPKNKTFPHKTAEELYAGVRRNFEAALQSKAGAVEARYTERFRVFCFKYDLEALLLGAEEALKDRLGIKKLPISWTIPVEDQDHDLPPKRVVERLFSQYGQRYKDTIDAPLILGASDYHDLARLCPQCFNPFVEFLEALN